MKCPYCGFLKDRVVDSRESRDGNERRETVPTSAAGGPGAGAEAGKLTVRCAEYGPTAWSAADELIHRFARRFGLSLQLHRRVVVDVADQDIGHDKLLDSGMISLRRPAFNGARVAVRELSTKQVQLLDQNL